MPQFSLSVGQKMYFGGGQEAFDMTLQDATMTDADTLKVLLQIQGRRIANTASVQEWRANAFEAQRVKDRVGTIENGVTFDRILMIMRNLHEGSYQIGIEFLGQEHFLGDVKFEVNGGEHNTGALVLISGAPQIPFAHPSVFHEILADYENGRSLKGEQSKLRKLYYDWLDEYGVTPEDRKG